MEMTYFSLGLTSVPLGLENMSGVLGLRVGVVGVEPGMAAAAAAAASFCCLALGIYALYNYCE